MDRFFKLLLVSAALLAGHAAAQTPVTPRINNLQLKTAPAVNPVVFRIDANMLPWAKRIDEVAKKEKPAVQTPDEEKLSRQQARVRERAIAALATDDEISFVITTEGNMWVGDFTGNTGLLRFVGKLMSAFSKDNLE